MQYKERIKKLRYALARRRLSGFLATSYASRRYFSGFSAEDMGCEESSGAVLVLKDVVYILTDPRYELQAQMDTQGAGSNVVIYRQKLADSLKKILKKHLRDPHLRIGFEPESISVSRYKEIKEALGGRIEFVPCQGLTERFSITKDPQELALLEAAVSCGEMCFEKALSRIRPGMTEKEAAWLILEEIYKHSDGPSFSPIVASGPNSALPHAVPGRRPIEEGKPVIIDMGVRLSGYCSDMTRTIFLGREPDKEFKSIYDCVKTAKETAQKGLRAGMTGRDADRLARKVIENAGYGPYFSHALGHGVGLNVHEAPSLSQRNRKKLPKGAVVTVEPGIYIPGKGGVRIEDMVVITEEGCRILGSRRWIYEFGI